MKKENKKGKRGRSLRPPMKKQHWDTAKWIIEKLFFPLVIVGLKGLLFGICNMTS